MTKHALLNKLKIDALELASLKLELEKLEGKVEATKLAVKESLDTLKLVKYDNELADFFIKCKTNNTVVVSEFKKLVTDKEFLESVSVTMKALGEVLPKKLHSKCTNSSMGTPYLEVKLKK